MKNEEKYVSRIKSILFFTRVTVIDLKNDERITVSKFFIDLPYSFPLGLRYLVA